MDALRQYFVLKRIQNGASECHWRPTAVKIDDQLRLHVDWSDVVRPISKTDNVACIDAITDDDPFAGLQQERDAEAARQAAEVELPSSDSDGDDEPNPVVVKHIKKKPTKGKKKIKPEDDYRTPADPCPCGCQMRTFRYRDMVKYIGGYYSARGACVFAEGRCACGCEKDIAEDAWRQRRLEQTTPQTEEGWNTWDKETDAKLKSWVLQRYYLEHDIQKLESSIAGHINPTQASRHRLTKWQARHYQVDTRIKRRRDELAAAALGRMMDEAEPVEEPVPVYTGPCTLQDIDKSTLSREVLIDGMCTALQRCHTLRIIHRNIRIENFAVQHFVDETGAAASADHTVAIAGKVTWGERPDGNRKHVRECLPEEVPQHRPTVVLRGWEHACFNPGNTAFKNAQRNTFTFPEWGETAPEMSGDAESRLEYGFEYDMWCLGLCIFQLMYDTALWDEVDPAEYTDAWLLRWFTAHPLQLMPNASLYQILLTVILTTDANKRACSYAAMNMTDGPRSVLFDRQMEVLVEAPTTERFRAKFPLAPPIGKMLSAWIGGILDSRIARKQARILRQAAHNAEQLELRARNADRQERRDAPEREAVERQARNVERQHRRDRLNEDEDVSSDEDEEEDEDVSSDEEDAEMESSDDEEKVDVIAPVISGAAFVKMLRDHDYTPRRITVPGAHWNGCKCGDCVVRARPPEIMLDETKPESRTEQTRVMYAMMASSSGGHEKIKGNKLIAIFSQLANAVLGDAPVERLDLEQWGFRGEDSFRRNLASSATSLKDLRIRL